MPSFFIIHDDVLIRETLESLLQSLLYDTEAFGSVDDYLNCGHILDAACLITDVQMPAKTGFDLLSRLRTDGCSIPIVFMSAHPEEVKPEVRARNPKRECLWTLGSKSIFGDAAAGLRSQQTYRQVSSAQGTER